MRTIKRPDGEFELREHETWGYRSEFGTAHFYLLCPYCGTTLKVYVWSIAGGGKRCNCGVLHTSGQSFKKLNNVKPIHPGKTNANFTLSERNEYQKKYNEWRKWEPKTPKTRIKNH